VKKVLHVIPSVGPLRGGPSAMVRGLARNLSLAGIETHVATTNDNGHGTLDVPCGVPVVEDGVSYWYFPRQTRFYTFSWPLTVWLARHVSEFDVVHIHALFSYSSLAASFWARRLGVPYVVRPLGTLNEWGMKNRRPWLKRLSFRLLERRVVSNAAVVHYASMDEQAQAETLDVTAPAAVIPNALQSATAPTADLKGRFRARHPQLQGRQVVLFLARIDAIKGVSLLLRAFAQIRHATPDAFLVVAGDGPTELVENLKGEAASLGIASQLLWPGFLEGDDKRAALADADVFALPSYSESFGIAVAEAMAAGLPVIVSDQVGIHDEISRARAGIIVSCDVGQLAAALTRLLGDATLRRSMGQDGQCLVRQKYSPQAVTRKVIGLYNEIAVPPLIGLEAAGNSVRSS